MLVVLCAGGLAVAKEKLILKYLPVAHDIENVTKDYTGIGNITLTQTNNTEAQNVILGHTRCLKCREYDSYNAALCPDCCLYNNTTAVQIHCQDASDPLCAKPPARPFATVDVNCTKTFERTPAMKCTCPGGCPKSPEPITHCQRHGCPDTARPNDATCINSTDPSVW